MLFPKHIITLSAVLAAFAVFSPFLIPAQEQTGYIKSLDPGVIYSTRMELTEENLDYATFRFTVSDKTVAVRIVIQGAEADLDLFVKRGADIESYDDVDYLSTAEDYNETLFISRFSDPPLTPGEHYFDVVYQRQKLPQKGDTVIREAVFSVMVESVSDEETKPLPAETAVASALVPQRGMFETYTIEVPEDAEALRVDLFESPGDLDLLLTRDRYTGGFFDAGFIAETLLSRESVLLDENSAAGPLAGRWYVTVIDQVASDVSVPYKILARFSPEPAPQLLEFPRLPADLDGFERALYSTVELIGESGKGSGCLVAPTGLILTSWHVVRGDSGRPEQDITVAVIGDPALPPLEAFKARVVEYDPRGDFALLEIVSGIYGQPLPGSYRFPFLSFTEDAGLSIGQTIGCIGFPGIGGTGSRASVSYTRGVISGYERSEAGTLIKTDGLINTGSSGGAAIDRDNRLIGLTTTVIEENAGQFGYIHPVSLLPGAWPEIIQSAGGR